jgi:hypothetical protein
MDYPVTCILSREKIEFCYRANELLRQLQNIFAKWYKEGLTQVEYNNIPLKLKTKYPYIAQISRETYKKFLREDFEPRLDVISGQISGLKNSLKDSMSWPVSIGDI